MPVNPTHQHGKRNMVAEPLEKTPWLPADDGQAPPITRISAGSDRARQLLLAARFMGAGSGADKTQHIAAQLHCKLEVLMLETSEKLMRVLDRRPLQPIPYARKDVQSYFKISCRRTDEAGKEKGGMDWLEERPKFTTEMLLSEGYFQQNNSCALMYIDDESMTPIVLALFVNGDAETSLAEAVKGHAELHKTMKRVYKNCNRDRPEVFMHGVRFNVHMLGKGYVSNPFSTGYYSAPTQAVALMDPKSAIHKSILQSSGAMCSMEAKLAPVVAARRLHVATTELRHPGILPGIQPEHCSAYTLGVSKGLIAPLHQDKEYPGLTETISWNTAGVHMGAQLMFCIYPAKVLFNLQSHHANMVMVPSGVTHGTPAVTPIEGGPRTHGGIGVVIVTKGNLKDKKAELYNLTQRLKSGSYPHCNPFSSQSPLYCYNCASDEPCPGCLAMLGNTLAAADPASPAQQNRAAAGGRDMDGVGSRELGSASSGDQYVLHQGKRNVVKEPSSTGRAARRAKRDVVKGPPHMAVSPPPPAGIGISSWRETRALHLSGHGVLGVKQMKHAHGWHGRVLDSLNKLDGEMSYVRMGLPGPHRRQLKSTSSGSEKGDRGQGFESGRRNCFGGGAASSHGNAGAGPGADAGPGDRKMVDRARGRSSLGSCAAGAGPSANAGAAGGSSAGPDAGPGPDCGPGPSQECTSSQTDYLLLRDIAAMSLSDRLAAVQGMIAELVPPGRGDSMLPPSCRPPAMQLWWSPYRNAFFTSRHRQQLDLVEVSQEAAREVWPAVDLEELCVTGLAMYDGMSCEAIELQVADWRDPKNQDVVDSAFLGASKAGLYERGRDDDADAAGLVAENSVWVDSFACRACSGIELQQQPPQRSTRSKGTETGQGMRSESGPAGHAALPSAWASPRLTRTAASKALVDVPACSSDGEDVLFVKMVPGDAGKNDRLHRSVHRGR